MTVTEEKLQELFGATVDELMKRIKDGSAKPADIAAAIKLLQQNGIQMEVTGDDALSRMAKALPKCSFDDEDDEMELIH